MPGVDVVNNLVFSAPCLEGSALKYMAFTRSWGGAWGAANNYMSVTGAVSATAAGVLTNEGPRWYTSSANGQGEIGAHAVRFWAGDVVHLIANARHVTIINEARGLNGIWELSMTDPHRFFGRAPLGQYNHSVSSNVSFSNIIVPTTSTTTRTTAITNALFGLTDLTTGTYYGTYDPTVSGVTNSPFWLQNATTYRANSITASGLPTYQVTPVLVHASALGYPVQSATGVVPIYWTKGSAGSTGDAIDINGDTYYYFNCGTGFGVAVKTS